MRSLSKKQYPDFGYLEGVIDTEELRKEFFRTLNNTLSPKDLQQQNSDDIIDVEVREVKDDR